MHGYSYVTKLPDNNMGQSGFRNVNSLDVYTQCDEPRSWLNVGDLDILAQIPLKFRVI